MLNRELQESFIKYQEDTFKKLIDLTKAKNNDYAGKDNDPFLNFKATEMIGNTSVEQGMIVRMLDKITRVTNLVKHEAKVKDESIHDTLHDLANYSILLSNYIAHKALMGKE